MSAYELRGVSIVGPRGVVIEETTTRIADRGVTVLLGPAGSGKSALLRALSGLPAPVQWRYHGTWLHRGRPLRDPAGIEIVAHDIAWAPQQRANRYGSTALAEPPTPWRQLLSSGARTVLLDEPNRACSDANDRGELTARLRDQATHGSAVVITHDLAFAREVGDDVKLLAARGLIAEGRAGEFFAKPPSPLAERFLRQGNCWPGNGVPALPSHFAWILHERLAGLGRPGLLGKEEDDLEAIALAGIKLLVTLTERPLAPDLLRPFAIVGRHFPINDMGVPAIGATARLCAEIERTMKRGDAVGVHCHAGLGRTGTILASMLVWLGRSPGEAIEEIRATGRAFIQNSAQQQFVYRFAEQV